jgi:hypothetical protein
MKYLNKIIFINSANIPYAEISVDGNVHFTGTQGVGKSTVLRALLFFYNADKQRLGIQSGQKTFDEFYFRQSNSYILYEVMRDNGAYTILVSRYQGRASWRFIDAPYQRQWLVDDHGQVASDWVKIRERIGSQVAVSRRIDSGTEFKDIIFGNTHDHKYTRYALVQSAQYQNIPRSIQNVFLNTKLDADFVKATIIQSMDEGEQPIDLQTYRRLVTDFEREYDEIDCWYRRARDGSYPVRQQALKIAEQGRMMVALDQQLADVWHQLNRAVAHSEQTVPQLEVKVADVQGEMAREKARGQELSDEYDKERDKLNQELGALKAKLKEIVQRRKYYDGEGIAEKLVLAGREAALQAEARSRQGQLDALLKAHRSIEEKYHMARTKLHNDRQAFDNELQAALFQYQEGLQQQRTHLEDQRTRDRNQLTAAADAWRRESDGRWQQLLSERSQADYALKELRRYHPLADALSKVTAQLQALAVQETENTARQASVKSEMGKVEAEYNGEEAQLRMEHQQEEAQLGQQRTLCQQQLARVDALLSKLGGSFYEWLNANMPSWQHTIGKVVDEQRILYAQGLDPQLAGAPDSLFGVKLNLDALDEVYRTPDEYRAEREAAAERLASINRQLTQLPVALQERIDKLGKRYGEKLNPLRQQLTQLRVEAGQLPLRRQNLQNDQHRLELEEQELIEQERQVRERAYNEAILNAKREEDARQRQADKHTKELKALDAAYNKAGRELGEQLRQFKEVQRQEAAQKHRDFDEQRRQLDAQEQAELAGKGVDPRLLEHHRQAVESVQAQLRQIDEVRQLVIQYRHEEQFLFALEPQTRQQVKEYEQNLTLIRQRYEYRRERITTKVKALDDRQRALLAELKRMRDGLDQYRQVIDHEHLVPEGLLTDDKTMTTSLSCQELLTMLRGTVNQKRETIDRLKDTVVGFNRYFKPQNAFHFNTTPVTDSDYLAIAANLQEFMDNNKIEEFRQRTSAHYKDILGRISTELGNLMKRRSEVDGVIADINRDFVEKNFAGVIRRIELRATDSSDRLMQLLMSIHHYTVEHAMTIGELNLFSSDNRDEVNAKVVDYLKSLAHQLMNEPSRDAVSLGDAFRLQFRVMENDNDTNWVERINNVGSDGTDILVKAMVNIMLINVFKKKAAKKSGDFIVHCMMDEIGRLHPNNIKGILQFANSRNIYLINSSPMSYNPYDYRYTYMLSKNGVKTRIDKLMERN